MKRILYLVILVALSSPLLAQPAVLGSYPADNATNVPLDVTVKVWFSAPIDTTSPFSPFYGFLTSIDTLVGQWYSADADTAYFHVRLAPSRAYFIAFYWLPGQGELPVPYTVQLTTGSSFTGTTVSGKVTSNSGALSPAYALVGLSDVAVGNSDPHFVAGGVADADGNYTIPHVANGTFYPITAIDVNGNGSIDPSSGDAVGIGEGIVVSGSPLTGVNLVLMASNPISYYTALDSALTFQAANLPGSVLRRVVSWSVDSAGQSGEGWEFHYLTPSSGIVSEVRVDPFLGSGFRTADFWVTQSVPLLRNLTNPSSAANSSTFLTNCEASGGAAFRHQVPPQNSQFRCLAQLGQLIYADYPWNGVTDSIGMYWMAKYQFEVQATPDSSYPVKQMWFVGNFSTGAIMSTLGVNDPSSGVPASFSLDQNYPNPFNPSTTIRYQISDISNLKLAVYDLLGRELAVLVDGRQEPGMYQVTWNATHAASGVYFYRLFAAGNGTTFVSTRKMVLAR
jgi:hypothetical protein